MSDKKWYVYMLICSDGTLYTGITTEPERRLQQHNAGVGAKYTRSRIPVSMVYREQVKDHSHALRREFQIKNLTREQKLKLIK